METTQKSNATFSKIVSLESAKASKGGLTHHVIKDGPKKGIAFFVFGDNDSAFISAKASKIIRENNKEDAIAMLSFGIVEYVDSESGVLKKAPTIFPNPNTWRDEHTTAEVW